MKNPFVKFVCHSASYLSFLALLACASQRFERLFAKVKRHFKNSGMKNKLSFNI